MSVSLGEDDLFVGRGAELSRLRDCAREVRSARPWVVLVAGPAGAGKTALVRHWLTHEDREDVILLRAYGDAAEADSSFGLVGQLIARMSGEQLHRFPLLRDGIPPASASSTQVAGQLLRLFDDLQTEGPVVVVIEDAHWSDDASLHVVKFVLRRLEADRVLTVITGRTPLPNEIRKLALDRERGCELVLRGLDENAVGELVHRATGEQPRLPVVQRLLEYTDGNALYLRTVLAEVPSEQLQGAADHTWAVPGTLAAALQRQLAALPAPARALTEAAAVLSVRAPLRTVGRLAGVDDTATALQPALTAQLMRWWPSDPSTPVMVAHALQRDAVLEGIAPGRRKALHAAAADLVDAAGAWRHKVAAADGADDELAAALEQAADDCVTAGEVERAATLLLWAADVASGQAEHERLLLTAAARLLSVVHMARAQDLLPRVRSCGPSPLRAAVVGAYAVIAGRLDEAESELSSALEATRDRPADEWTAAFAGTQLAITYLFRGTHGEEMMRVSRDVLGLSRPDRVLDYLSKSTLVYGRLYMDGPSAGLKELENIAPLPSVRHVPPADAYLLNYRGRMRMHCAMPSAAREDLTQVLLLAEKGGGGQGLEEYAHAFLVLAHYWTGAWDDAAMHADLAVTTATAEQRVYAYADVYGVSALVPAGRGDTQHAQELLHAAEQYVLPFNAGPVHMCRAIEAQARADWPAMVEAINNLLQAPPGRVLAHQVMWKPLQCEALIRTECLDKAAGAVSELAAMSDSYPALTPSAAWLSGLLAEARHDTPAARTHYERGLALPDAPDDHALHRAFLAHSYGRLLSGMGRPQLAGTWLERARKRYRSLRASAFLARCEDDLASALSLNPATRADRPLGLASLTGRERDIAHLVSQGYTNKEIAGQLFLSSKTVEHHLGHIYSKLSIANRRQLRDHVRRQTL
ncbi:AAA family ATPase [Streptomyces sp. NPDC001928]|uniref:ATP-binding protein n=1 Tax=Streptomyces sp. NPDC001928 TaxID=3154404 RepID=UPI003326DE3E